MFSSFKRRGVFFAAPSLASPALGADPPAQKSPPPPIFTWMGLYVGYYGGNSCWRWYGSNWNAC